MVKRIDEATADEVEEAKRLKGGESFFDVDQEAAVQHAVQNASANKSSIYEKGKQYLDQCILIGATVALADVIARLFRAVKEFVCYGSHYVDGDRTWSVFKRAFTYDLPSLILLVLVVSGAIIRSFLKKKFPYRILAFMPLYWIFLLCNLQHSTLDYAYFIRAPTGLDYAEGMADNYFHGYLKLALPPHDQPPGGIRDRIAAYQKQYNATFAADRLLIFIPTKMYVHPTFENKLLQKVEPLQMVRRQRAGVSRPYQNDVYRFKEPINGTHYHVVLEGATPMLTFFESVNSQLTSTWQMKTMQREISFKFFNHLKRILHEWPETRNDVEVIFHDDDVMDDNILDAESTIKTHVLKILS